ncbi:entericidin A/B family lipoprotein [Iodobacter ciconiae]|uniref:Entericidin A/B family lipoprotein n=1 Tax=Iodobacter ciconiae TaxID=2496266 RepID=A0A3S8ZSU1_9NEIS|nr:entericidin A/B family lipoprotein [Iodobacter ciconiae]AZN36538.1 entericidin A/B family lipoprotein [Iodobacter ciconiae]
MKKIATLTLMFLMLGLPACNTVSGMGKDIKKGGEAIEKAANK